LNNKGKVLLVIHDNYQDDNIYPLGPGYLAAMLKKNGAKVSTYCMDVFHHTNKELADYLRSNEFDLIGLGFMAPRFKRTVEALCTLINKNKKEAWLVLGGTGPTPIPEYILKVTKADVVILGEAEETIVDLLYCKISNPEKISDIRGLAYRTDNKIVLNERRKPVMKLDTLPYPAWDLFPMEQYTTCMKFAGMKDTEKSFPVLTTRGCINKCSFCYRMEKGIRIRNPQNVIEEMKTLNRNYGITYFHFADELSIVSKKQILEFTSLLLKNRLDIKYRMDCRVALFDDDIANCLKESGCVFLNIGFESTDQHVLDLLKKNVTVEQNIRAAEIAHKYGIGIGLNFLWGLPGDSEKSLRKNAEFIKRYNMYDQIRAIRPVTPYPGASLYYEAIQRGLLKGPEDFFARFKNADLYMINFMGIPEQDIYQLLFEVNKDLILDYYKHTNNDMEQANWLIEQFYNLYFKKDSSFSGPRHYLSATK
jgi:anaerobic magnesium-protoporphyrin IX monomethyl ester cyclase